MKVIKIETNLKRKLYLHQTDNVSLSPISSTLESNIIQIDPNYQFQEWLGFGGAMTRKCCL